MTRAIKAFRTIHLVRTLVNYIIKPLITSSIRMAKRFLLGTIIVTIAKKANSTNFKQHVESLSCNRKKDKG